MKNLWLLSILLLVDILARSQIMPVENDPYARFGHLTVSDGLPDNHITVIRQDEEGFMWIGTRKGLARYDGTRFHVFQHHPNDSTTLASNYINDILITPDQTIYAGTRKGLSIFKPDVFHFQQVPVLFQEGSGLHDSHIRALLYEDENHIWVETYNGVLHLLNTQTFEAKTWPHEKPSQPYYDYHALYKDSRHTLWIGGRNLRPLKMKNKVITPIETSSTDPSKKREPDVAFFYEDRAQDFWIGGLDGLYQYDREKDTVNKRMHTSSYAMAESSEGNLWIATGKGLAKMDKEKRTITKYLASDNSPSSIIHNNINCVTIDNKGNIWAGTDRGISILNTTQNLIRHYKRLPHLQKSLSNNHVSCFLEDKKGHIWVGTRGGGLNRFDPDERHFDIINRSNSGLSSNQVSSIHQDHKGILWAGLWRGVGFNRLNPETMNFTQYALDSATLKKDWYSGFESLGQDTLVAGFWGAEGIRFFDKTHRKWLPHSFRPFDHPADAPLHHLVATDSLLWLYRRGDMISSFSPFNHSFKTYRTKKKERRNARIQIKSADLPPFNDVREIVKSAHLTLFLTNKGIVAFDSRQKQFKTISQTPYRLATKPENNQNIYLLGKKGLATFNPRDEKINLIIAASELPTDEKKIKDFLLLSETNLLLASSSEFLSIGLPTGHSLKLPARFEEINQANQLIRNIEKGPGNSLIVLFNRGFALLSKEKGTSFYNTGNAFDLGLRNDQVHVVKSTKSREGLWLGTDRGLYLFSLQNRQFKEIPSLKNRSINDLALFNDHLYITTDRGLARLTCITGEVTFFNHPPDDMLSSHLVTFIKKDSKGRIWAGTTDKGLNRIDPRNLRIKHFLPGQNFHGEEVQAFLETTDKKIFAGGDSLNVFNPESDSFKVASFSEHLPGGKILALTEDHLGRILITTSHHIHIYDPQANRLFDLTPYLGTDNITFTPASLRSSAQEIYLGSAKGFFKFNPALLEPPTEAKQTRITDIKIRGKRINNPYLIQDGIDLSPNQNFIQLFFSDMAYPPNHDQYLYKLQGIDHGWIATNNASAMYNMIPPGKYTFKVKTVNPFGASIEQSIPVTIHPPFWKTWWFILIIISLTALVAGYWWRHRLNHLRIIENNLQLRHRLLLSQMNPHFIFNALSAIQAFILQNHPQKAGAYLSRFAKLMRLNLNNMSSTVISISEETETLNHYLELQSLRHNGSFSYSVKVIPDRDHPNLGVPTMMVQPFVENAVEHGIKNIEYHGKIEVTFILQNNNWHITITDNGAGIENTRKDKTESSHKSMGMKITRDRLTQIEKQYKHPCNLEITDRSKENPDSENGTTVALNLPVIKTNSTPC